METKDEASPVEGVVIRPEWRYVRGLVTNREYHRIYRDDKLGVQLEVVTKRRYGMPSGHGKSYFFIDGNDYEFKCEESMMVAWNAREANRQRNKNAV